MVELSTKKIVCLVGVGLCLLSGAWWLMDRNKVVYDDNLINMPELSDEFMEEFFEDYAIMAAEGEQENILIVVSYDDLDGYGAKEIVEGPNHTYYLMYETAEEKDAAYEILNESGVFSVEKNQKMELLSYNSWGIEAMGIDEGIQALGSGGQDVKVAIVDTGLDVNKFRQYYPDKALSVYDIQTNSDSLEEMRDEIGHGTHIAGTVAEGSIDQTSIMAVKIASSEDELYVTNVTTGIYKAIEAGADVINLSLGGLDYSTSQKLALDAANAEKIVAVAAVGNGNSSTLFYPASYDNTISVAALDRNLKRAVWDESSNLGSNYNAMVDYAAPGTAIRSMNAIASGTSVAAPHVTAAVAILKNFNNNLGLNEVNILLRRHVVDLGEEGKDDYYGYGMIDFNDAEFCGDGYCDEYGVFAINMSAYVDDGVEIEVLEDGIKITADEACMVLISDDEGETYERVSAEVVSEEENTYKFTFDVASEVKTMVVLNGDGDMDGEISSADSNLINRSLVSPSSKPYRALSSLEEIIFDLDRDGEISSADSNLINRSLISQTLRPYKKIAW